MKRTLPLLVPALLALSVLTACDPRVVAAYDELLDQNDHVLTDAELGRLRECESGGRYDIVSANGRHRGAYQFLQSTWDTVAERHFPWMEGNDPAESIPAEQDAMARALWSETNGRAWPRCSKRV